MSWVEAREGGSSLHVKAVPGSSRDRVEGLLGDHLKVAVSAPPEGGRANERLCAVLARALGIPERQVRVATGDSRSRKTVAVDGLAPEQVRQRLGLP